MITLQKKVKGGVSAVIAIALIILSILIIVLAIGYAMGWLHYLTQPIGLDQKAAQKHAQEWCNAKSISGTRCVVKTCSLKGTCIISLNGTTKSLQCPGAADWRSECHELSTTPTGRP